MKETVPSLVLKPGLRFKGSERLDVRSDMAVSLELSANYFEPCAPCQPLITNYRYHLKDRVLFMLLDQYLVELKKIRLLEPEEEQALWQGFKLEGDPDCRRRLIEHYQPLVFKVATSWRMSEPAMMDIIQEGTVGLIEAVENYDYSRGVAFSLYATHRIRGRMLNFMEKEGRHEKVSLGEQQSEEYIAAMGESLFADELPVAEQAEHNYLVAQVRNAMERLPAKEQLVLNSVYLEDCDPKQLATTLNMSLSHIYRLQKQGIRRVRGMLSRMMQHW